MKTITSTLSGLASSLFLSAGFTQVAQTFDPVTDRSAAIAACTEGPAFCFPSSFTPKPRKS